MSEGDRTESMDLSGDIFKADWKLNEEKSDNNSVIATCSGIIMGPFGVDNGNGRIYTEEAIKQGVIDNEYVQRMLKYKTLLGEPHHPPERYEIWANHVSHSIRELHISDDHKYLMGTIDILNTPNGRILKTLLEYGSTLGVSVRAYGQSEKRGNGLYIIPDTYTFKTVDVVMNPGFVEARVHEINESFNDTKSLSDIISSLSESNDIQDIKNARVLIDYCEDSNIKNLKSSLDERLSELEAADTNSSDVDFYISEISNLKEELISLKRQNKSLIDYKQLCLLKSKNQHTLEQRCKQVTDKLHSLKEEYKSAVNYTRGLEDSLVKSSNEIRDVRNKNKSLDKSNQSLVESNQDLGKFSEELSNSLSDLKNRLDKSENQCKSLRGKLEELKSSNESKLDSYKKLGTENKKLKKQNSELVKTNKGLNESISNLTSKLDFLNNQLRLNSLNESYLSRQQDYPELTRTNASNTDSVKERTHSRVLGGLLKKMR